MYMTSLKIVSLSIIAAGITASTALAGGGENCDHKKKAAMKTQTSTQTATQAAVTTAPQTVVLSSGQQSTTMAAKSKRKVLSFDDALKLCQSKGVADLQACVDYKTGVTKVKPQS